MYMNDNNNNNDSDNDNDTNNIFWRRRTNSRTIMQLKHCSNVTVEIRMRAFEWGGARRMSASRILEVDKGSFTLLVFTTIRGKADECKRYRSRLAELLSTKRGENYSTTVSFAPKSHSPSWDLRCCAWQGRVDNEFVIDKELASF